MALVLLTLALYAQVVIPPPPLAAPPSPPVEKPAPSLPANWFGAGAAYSNVSKPAVSGWFSYAILLSASAKIYSFTTHDLTSTRSKPYTIQSSVRSGIAPLLRQIGPVSILGFGDAGMAGAQQSVAGAFSGGGIVVWRLGKTDWTLVASVRELKSNVSGAETQQIYEFGLGRTW